MDKKEKEFFDELLKNMSEAQFGGVPVEFVTGNYGSSNMLKKNIKKDSDQNE